MFVVLVVRVSDDGTLMVMIDMCVNDGRRGVYK